VGAYARDTDIPQARLRQRISSLALIGALQRVKDPDAGPRFLIKGGVAMELRLGMGARATKDFDVVFRGPIEGLLKSLDEAFAEPYAGFQFRRSGQPVYIGETSTQRQNIKISFHGRGWQTLTVEAARPEGTRGGDPEMVLAAISVSQFGLESPERIAVMTVRYQIAQKLHAVTEQPPDRENARYWDLIDLLLLRDLVEDLSDARDACIEVFDNRETHPWPPELLIPNSWEEPYKIEAEKLKFNPADVHEAAAAVRAFIAEIDAKLRRID
jgi:Nucleotidyl transferase AbiEii toxin, Type IV TA system